MIMALSNMPLTRRLGLPIPDPRDKEQVTLSQSVMTANGPSYVINPAMLPQEISPALANAFTLPTPTRPIPADMGRVPVVHGAFEDPEFVEASARLSTIADREVLSLVTKTPYSP